MALGSNHTMRFKNLLALDNLVVLLAVWRSVWLAILSAVLRNQ